MIDRKPFFDRLRTKVGHFNQHQVDGFELLLECWEYLNWDDLRWLAYCLATAWWETGHRMQPVDEIGKGTGHLYGMPAGPFKLVYYGRGYVQLTWCANYEHVTEQLRIMGFDLVDLVKNPDQANDPSIAALILFHGMHAGWFDPGPPPHTLARYFPENSQDPVGARHIVNGTDHASEIAAVYEDFVYALGG